MSGVSGPFQRFSKALFSQTRFLENRKKANLHPISELGRFHLLVCCYFCSICVSLTYAFDLFTTQIRRQFNLSSGDLTIVSTIGLVFCYFTIPYSIIFENLGPLLTFWMCAIAALIGGVGLAGVFQGYIPGNTATLTVFYAFLNAASGLLDTSYISTLFEVFPRNRGPVVCLAKVMTGLGSSVLATLSDTLFDGSITGFVYFLMSLCITVSIWASFVIVLPPYIMNWWRRRGKSEEAIAALESTKAVYEKKFVPLPRLIIGYVVVISLVVFFAVESPLVAYLNVSSGAKTAIGILTVVLTLCIFLMLLPLPCLGGLNEAAPEGFRAIEADSPSSFISPEKPCSAWEPMNCEEMQSPDFVEPMAEETPDSAAATAVAEKVEESHQDPRYKGTVVDYLLMPDTWLIMLLFVCYGCIGTLVMYNSSTISVALKGNERSEATSALYTSFLGIGSSVGRIAFGLFEAYVQHQKPENRKVLVTMALPVSPLLGFLGGLFLLVLPGDAVLFPFILVYLEEGIFAGANALIFPCLFESHHNFLYNLSFLVQCICIISFNLGMFGQTVDKKQSALGIPSDMECNVRSCVQTPLIVATVLAFCGIFVALTIHFRYAAFVRRERARVAAAQDADAVPQSETEAAVQ